MSKLTRTMCLRGVLWYASVALDWWTSSHDVEAPNYRALVISRSGVQKSLLYIVTLSCLGHDFRIDLPNWANAS